MVKVSLVGAGPGDPDLLTLKALRLLQSADVILYDRLVSAEILALANPQAEFIYTGKEEGHQDAVQQQIFDLLLTHASAGKHVVRLKSGDPFLFGRGGEEMLYLRQRGIAVEVVPGISSSLAAPACAGIPVTYRGVASSVAVVTARCKGGSANDWQKLAQIDTLVVLMGVKYRSNLAQSLINAGRAATEPAAFIERGSTVDQRVVECTLGEIAAGQVKDIIAPAVLVIGKVVRLRALLAEDAETALAEGVAPHGIAASR